MHQTLQRLFNKRPFRNRNAENFDLAEILEVFVDPIPSGVNPFDFENSIVKGRMGSGKTMFLKANLAYHLYTMIPCLLENQPPTIPVFIRLSDFQHLDEPKDIYRAIIVSIVEGLSKAYQEIQSCERMVQIHRGIQTLPGDTGAGRKLPTMMQTLSKLGAEEYVETISSKLGLDGSVRPEFIEIAGRYEKEQVMEVKSKAQPGIADVKRAFEFLLADRKGRILLLVDEAGSLSKRFFTEDGNNSLFEIWMNQLRTTEFLRTKIAIYPNTYSDVLIETRYGDLVDLSDDVVDPVGYDQFARKTATLVNKYFFNAGEQSLRIMDLFESGETGSEDAVEQIIYASGGNMRRLVQVLDQSMNVASYDTTAPPRVSARHVAEALKRQSHSVEALYSDGEREFLDDVAKVCRARNTFRFQFPYKAPALLKYVSKSEEHNLLRIVEAGGGRKSTTYAFDYAYCVNHEIPTHYVKETERIDKSRSQRTGSWISRIAQLNETLVKHASLLNKVNGVVAFVARQSGFIKEDNTEKQYWFAFQDVVSDDRKGPIIAGRRVRFCPAEFQGEPIGVAVEML